MRHRHSGRCLAGVVGALLLLLLALPAGGFITSAGAASKPTPAPTASGPRVGTLTLAQASIPAGTASVDAHLAGYKPGDTVTIIANGAQAGPGGLNLYPGTVAVDDAGTASVTLKIPLIAPAGTYDVAANAEKSNTRGQAFLTITPPAPASTPPGPVGAPTLVIPTTVVLGASGTAPTLRAAVTNFAAGATVTVTLLALGSTTATTTTGSPVDLGTIGPLDTRGAGAATFDLPRDIQPGTYQVNASGRAGVTGETGSAATSLTVQASGVNLTSDTFAGLWNNATQGLLVWWSDFSDKGRDDLLTSMYKAALHAIDPTRGVFATIYSWSRPLAEFGLKIIGILLLFRCCFELSAYFTGGLQLWRIGLTLMGVILTVAVWRNLPGIEHTIYQFANDWTDNLATVGVGSVKKAIDQFTALNKADITSVAGWALGTVAAGAYLILVAYLFAVIVLTKISGLGLIVLTAILGSLCIPFYVLPQTRGVAQWWAHMALSVMSWSPMYAWLFAAMGEIMLTIARSDSVT